MASALRFTVAAIEKLPFAPGEAKVIYWDESTPCFGLRVSKATKTFFIQVTRRKGGQLIKHTIGTFPTWNVEDARKEARGLIADIDRGIDIKAKRQNALNANKKLGELFQEYITQKRTLEQLSDRTISDYTYYLNRYFKDWQNVAYTRITRKMVSDRFVEVTEKYGKAQANIAFRFLRTLLYWAMAEYGKERMTENPVTILGEKSMWHKIAPKQNVIPPHKLKDWVNAALDMDSEMAGRWGIETEINHLYCLIVLFTGKRKTAALQLEWANVDLRARWLQHVNADGSTKNQSPYFPITPFVYELFKRLEHLRKKTPRPDIQKSFVFPSSKSKSGHIDEPKRALLRINKKAGVEVSFHDLRRTFNSILNRLGTDEETKRVLMGHATDKNNVNLTHYTITFMDQLRQACQDFEDYVLKAEFTDTSEIRPIRK